MSLPCRIAALALVLSAVGPSAFAQSADIAASVAEPASQTPTLFANPDLVRHYQQTITPEDLAAHLYLFSSDHFEGRETGMPGQKLAAKYLAAQYRKMGLEPMGTVKTSEPFAPEAYFQPFTVYGRQLGEARLVVTSNGDTLAASTFSPEYQDDQAYLLLGGAGDISGDVAFVGYGIADEELGYDDYAAARRQGLNLSQKWLLMLADEPLASASKSLLPTPDGKPSRWTDNIIEKLRAGRDAKGILIVGDLGPRGTASIASEAAQMAYNLERAAGALSLSNDVPMRYGPPVYVISKELADRILAPAGRTVEELKREIDAGLDPVVFGIGGVRVASAITRPVVAFQTENVLAYVEGSDPELKDEVVVISSHYDHIGIDAWKEGDNINNGADDDGSGTVTTLEIAEAFMAAKKAGDGPRRSVLFLNVSGEEKGLLGSEYYADVAPVWPLDKTVANLNIDMIGRFDPTHPTGSENYVYIIGSNLISEELHNINLRANELTGTNLELDERFNSKDDPNQFYARSDHWNFGKHGIPFIFFFTGTHDDYHGVDDEPGKIAYDRMARIAQVIFATAWQVANQDDPPAVTGSGFH